MNLQLIKIDHGSELLRFDYKCIHIVENTMMRKDYHTKLVEQYSTVETKEGILELKVIESFATYYANEGDTMVLYFVFSSQTVS